MSVYYGKPTVEKCFGYVIKFGLIHCRDCMCKWAMTSCPFQIREHPLYHLIKAQAKKKTGELTEAIQTLQMAMSLPSVRRAGSSSKSKNKKIELNPADCVSVFLELAEALWLNGEQVK